MMLKRLSHTLVINTVTIAITNPITKPRCTLAHVNAKCSRSRELVGPLSRSLAANAMITRPSPSPAKVPRTDAASA